MAEQPPTEDWRQRTLTPFKEAHRAFLAPGYATAAQAIAVVVANFGVRPGNVHPNDANMYVTLGGITAKNLDGPTTFQVDVAYGYMAQVYSAGRDLPPLQQPTRWQILPGLDGREVEVDSIGNLVTNSANTPFTPKDQQTVSSLFIQATRFYPNFSLALALQYMNKVNAVDIQVKSLGVVKRYNFKCSLIAPTSEILLDVPSPIEVVHKFEVRGPLVSGDQDDPGFAVRHVDKGSFGWYQASDGTTKPGEFSIPDPSTSGTTYITCPTEVLLDGTGKPIPSALAAGVRIGTGAFANTKTPVSPRYQVPDVVKRIRLLGEAYHLVWEELPTVDFGPLLAGL